MHEKGSSESGLTRHCKHYYVVLYSMMSPDCAEIVEGGSSSLIEGGTLSPVVVEGGTSSPL